MKTKWRPKAGDSAVAVIAVGETIPAQKKMALADRKDWKEWFKCHKRIYLSNTIFRSWIEAKYSAGCGSCGDSDFVAHLLSLEYRRH